MLEDALLSLSMSNTGGKDSEEERERWFGRVRAC